MAEQVFEAAGLAPPGGRFGEDCERAGGHQRLRYDGDGA
jgi:hypothetical protein